MQSKTKYPVTPAQIRAVFAAAGLGEASDGVSLSDGWYNNVLSVTAGGRDYIVKVAPEPGVKVLTHESGLLARELRFIALLAENGVRVPKVCAEDRSRTIIPCDYFIMEKLGGVRLDKARLRGQEKRRAEALIVGMMEKFHAIPGEGFGYEQMGLESDWYRALRRMVQALVGDCAGFGKRCRIGERLLRHVDAHRAILEAVPSVLVNFDVHSMNLFYDEGGLTVIDLERCFWGDRVGDYVMRGYGQTARFSREEKIRLHLMEAYLAVIMHTEKYSRYRPWNAIWWMDVAGAAWFGLKGFGGLRGGGKARNNLKLPGATASP